MEETASGASYRYWAFISYSHADEKWATWLHRAIETYRVPKALIGAPGPSGAAPARLFPIFRDRDELPGAASLNAQIRDALEQSRALIVICSPNAVRSRWVNEEIKTFKSLGRGNAVFPVIVGGEPNASDWPGREAEECFPEAARFQIGPDGTVLAEREEPLAADLRANGDDRRGAVLKLVAGVLGMPLDSLRRRDDQRRKRRNRLASGAAVFTIAALTVAVWYTNTQRLRAEEQTRQALAGRLTAESRLKSKTDIGLGLLLAAESYRAKPTVEAKSALISALRMHPMLLAHLGTATGAAGQRHDVLALAFSPDGRLLASGTWDGTITLWDMERRSMIGEPLKGHTDRVVCLAFRRDGRMLASGSSDYTVRLWDVEKHAPAGEPLRGHNGEVTSVAFLPDGLTLLTGGGGPHLLEWDLATRKVRRSLLPEADLSHTVAAVTPDGRRVVANTLGFQLALWDSGALGGQPAVIDVEKLQDILNSGLAISPDSKYLAIGGNDKTAVFWDLEERRITGYPLIGHSSSIESMAFSADGNVLATAGQDGTVRLWRARYVETQFARPLTAHQGWVRAVAFSPAAPILASGGADGRIYLWNIDAPPPIATRLARKPVQVGALAYSPDGNRLAIAEEQALVLWDTAAQKEAARIDQPHNSAIDDLAYTPDGNSVISLGGYPREFAVWRVEKGSLTLSRRVPADQLGSHFVMAPDGQHLVAEDGNGGLSVRRLPGLAETAKAGFPQDGRIGVVSAWAAQKIIVAGGADGRIHFLDPGSLVAKRQPIAVHKGSFLTLASSPDGKWIAAVPQGLKGVIQLVGEDGRLAPTPLLGDPEDHGFNRIAFSPDGTMLVAAGSPLFEIWDIASRKEIGEAMGGHYRGVRTIAAHPVKPFVATGSYDPDVYIWNLNPDDWQRRACGIANRAFTCEEWREYMGSAPYHPACERGAPPQCN